MDSGGISECGIAVVSGGMCEILFGKSGEMSFSLMVEDFGMSEDGAANSW
jgi:hypothetical protein